QQRPGIGAGQRGGLPERRVPGLEPGDLTASALGAWRLLLCRQSPCPPGLRSRHKPSRAVHRHQPSSGPGTAAAGGPRRSAVEDGQPGPAQGQPKQPPAGPQVLASVYRDTANFSGLPPVEQISNPKSTCPSRAPALTSP